MLPEESKKRKSSIERSSAMQAAIEALSDADAWTAATGKLTGNDAEKFLKLLEILSERTDLGIWRKYLRMSKRTVTVHYKRLDGSTLEGALARAWLWSEFFMEESQRK